MTLISRVIATLIIITEITGQPVGNYSGTLISPYNLQPFQASLHASILFASVKENSTFPSLVLPDGLANAHSNYIFTQNKSTKYSNKIHMVCKLERKMNAYRFVGEIIATILKHTERYDLFIILAYITYTSTGKSVTLNS
jgi:hypothetical protein